MIEIFEYSDSVVVECPFPNEIDRSDRGDRYDIENELRETKEITEDLDGFREGANYISHKYDVTLEIKEKD